MSKSDNQQSMSEALRSFLEKNNLQKGLDQVSVAETWNEVMGPGVASYTRAVRLQRETLYVYLTSSVLREELSLGNSKIISMLNEQLGREIIKTLVLQ